MIKRFKKTKVKSPLGTNNIGVSKILSVIVLATTVSVLPVQAQNISIDGNTNTIIQNNANTTNISTSTIHNSTAFNSFKSFNIPESEIVNLLLPDTTSSLVNLIKQGPSNINGTLNSIMNGKPGGNVFLVNPNGVVVGNTGVINVGSLVVATPTTNFVDNFFDAPGVVNVESFNALQEGSYAINSNAQFKNYGVIQALDSVNITAGSVINDGDIATGCIAEGKVDFKDIINADDIKNGGYIVAEKSNITIKASEDIINRGSIAAYGVGASEQNYVHLKADNNINLLANSKVKSRGLLEDSYGGEIISLAGNDSLFEEGAVLDVSGGNNSGNAGFIELSADDTVYAYGQFKASVSNGEAGTIFIDPDQVITNNVITDGADYIVNADNIIVQGVMISTRNIADPAGGDHVSDPSEGNSGQLVLNAFDTIDIQAGSSVYTFADNGFNSPVAMFVGETVNIDQSELMLGEARVESTNVNLTDQTAFASNGNVLFTLVGDALMTMNESLINADNGIIIGGNTAEFTMTDSTLFAEGPNGLSIDVDTLTINTSASDSAIWSLMGGIDITTQQFEINPFAETTVSFLAFDDVKIQSEDLIFDGLVSDNKDIAIQANGDVTFQSQADGFMDLYVTNIAAGGGINFDVPGGQVTILDSNLYSAGTAGISASTFSFNFVGDLADASMTTDTGGVTIEALQTTFEAGLGKIEVEVNGEQSNFDISGAALAIGAIDNDLYITVNDGDILFDMFFGTLIEAQGGHSLEFKASNNIELNSNFVAMEGQGIEFTSGNDTTFVLGDFDESLIGDSVFTAGRNFVIDGPDTLLTIASTNIDAETIDIQTDKLAIDADVTESTLNATGEFAMFVAGELVFASTAANLNVNVPNGVIAIASPDILFETPAVGNDVVFNAQDALFVGDSIELGDPLGSLTPGSIDINLTNDFLMLNRGQPPQAMAFPTSVNSQITDAVTQSNVIVNDVIIRNTSINANNAVIYSNSNVQLQNSSVDTANGIVFDLEPLAPGDEPAIVLIDTDLIARGEDGILLKAEGLLAYSETRDFTISSEASNLTVESNFTNIFGNLAGSTITIEAANNILFDGDHTNLGLNILNPFENDFILDITAGNNFVVQDFAPTTLIMNNSVVRAAGIGITSEYGVVTIQDSYLEATSSYGLNINAAEIGILADANDCLLRTTNGHIDLTSATNISVLRSNDAVQPIFSSAFEIIFDAQGAAPDDGFIEITGADIDSNDRMLFLANNEMYIYDQTTIDSLAPIYFVAPDMYLGCNNVPGEAPGLHVESPVSVTMITDNLTVDPSSGTEIGANGSLNVARLTEGDFYYGNNEPNGTLNVTPNELNNLWSSFVVLGNMPGENELTNNTVIDAPLGVPNGITLYSNDSITMTPGSGIWAFSTVMNSDTITIGDGCTINSEVVDLTADNFNISTQGGTAITGNTDVKIDRKTPGDFIISDTGNLRGLNSVSAVSNISRRVSLGLNTNNIQNVAFGEAVNMPCLFEINAQGTIIDTLNTEDPNITSEGLTITAQSVGTEDEDFNFSLASGVLSFDLTGGAYLNSTNGDVVIDSMNLFDPVTSEFFDIVLQTTNGGIFLTPNITEIIADNAHLFADGDVNLKVNVLDMAEVMGNDVILSAEGFFVDVLANNTLTVTDITGDIVWLFAGDDSTFTNVVANGIMLSQVDGQLVIDNLDSGMTTLSSAGSLNMTNSTVNGLFAIESLANVIIQGQFNDVIGADVANAFALNNSGTTYIEFVQASDVGIVSQGSILDAEDTTDPNIIAQNIDLTSAAGSIGSIGNPLDVELTASRIDANAAGLINIIANSDFELGNVISQNSDVRLEAKNAFIMADNGVIRGNHISVLGNEIQVSNNTIIEGTGNVGFAVDAFTVSTPVAPAITADGAIVLSRYTPGGMIIQTDGIQQANSRAPIHLDLDLFVADELIIGNSVLTNNNTNTIFVDDQIIYDRNKLTLSANDLIYDRDDNQPSVVADNLTLISGKDIGLKDNLFDADIENVLQVTAGGSIYLKDHNKNLVIDTIADEDGSIYLSTSTGDIYIGTICALKQIVIEAGGKVVSIDHIDPEDVIISVGDSSGTIIVNDGSVSSSVDLKANTINANFTDTGTSGVTYDLSNINNTRADQINVVANSSNSSIFNRLLAINAVIRNNVTGGSVVLNNADISGALTLSGDNISTPNRVSVQNVSLTGINSGMANSIYFVANDSLKVDILRANETHIATSGDILDIRNALVYDSGYFANNTKKVVLDNIGSFTDYSSVDAIISTRNIFDLYLDTSNNIKTTANVLFLSPDISVNGTRNGDEVGKVLALTTRQAYSYMDNAANKTYYNDYTSDFFYHDDVNIFAFVMSESYNDQQNFGVTNYILDKAIIVYRDALLNKYTDDESLEKAVNVLKQANMTKEVAQQLLNNPVYEPKPDSQKILNYYITD